jgi:hypothetical protein
MGNEKECARHRGRTTEIFKFSCSVFSVFSAIRPFLLLRSGRARVEWRQPLMRMDYCDETNPLDKHRLDIPFAKPCKFLILAVRIGPARGHRRA